MKTLRLSIIAYLLSVVGAVAQSEGYALGAPGGSITIAGTSTSLGGSISLDTITGLSSTGLVKRSGANTLAIATAGTDYQGIGAAFSPAFSATKNSTQSIPANGFQKVTFGTENFDTNSNFASSTFTVTVPGKYFFSARVQCSTLNSGKDFIVSLFKNGAELLRGNNDVTDSTRSASALVCGEIDCAATDTIEVFAFQDDSVDRNVGDTSGADTYFQGFRIPQ